MLASPFALPSQESNLKAKALQGQLEGIQSRLVNQERCVWLLLPFAMLSVAVRL